IQKRHGHQQWESRADNRSPPKWYGYQLDRSNHEDPDDEVPSLGSTQGSQCLGRGPSQSQYRRDNDARLKHALANREPIPSLGAGSFFKPFHGNRHIDRWPRFLEPLRPADPRNWVRDSP